MKQQFNRIITGILALLLSVGLLAVPAFAEEANSGTCGENLTWTLNEGVLTISGTGAMNDYNEYEVAPWDAHTQMIQRIVISDGVTAIGRRAFYGMSNLTTVTMPSSVTKLGALAFADCTRLVQIPLPAIEQIGWGCFYGCTSLANVTLPDSLRSIGEQAFYNCTKLGGITIPASVEEMGIMVFSYCKSMVYVNMQAKLTVLPNWTFYGCVLLWEVYLPTSIQEVQENAFGECPSLFYVDYGGSREVKDAIKAQLDQPTVMKPEVEMPADVTYTQTENATITTTTNYGSSSEGSTDSEESGTIIEATITSPEGWSDVIDSVSESLDKGETPEVIIQIPADVPMNENVLADLADEGVTVTVHTSDNVSWEIIMQDQTAETISGTQDFNVSIDKNAAGTHKETIGDSSSYAVSMGHTTLRTTITFPMGKENARRVATLYVDNGNSLQKLLSVIVDDDGMAEFSLSGTYAGQYVVALDVDGISKDEVRIPQSLAGEYGIDFNDGTLMDKYGNKYVVTGMTNELGFGMGTMTIIIVSVLVGSAVVVGVVMTLWQKQRKKAMAGIYADAPEKMPRRAEKNSDRREKSSEKKESVAKKKPEEKKKAASAMEEKDEKASDTKDGFAALAECVRRRKTENGGEKHPVSKEKKK